MPPSAPPPVQPTDPTTTPPGTQVDAIEKIEAAGVKVQRFPTPVLEALRKASHEVMQEEAAKDPLFKEAYLSLTAYMKRVGRWGQLQALPGTTN